MEYCHHLGGFLIVHEATRNFLFLSSFYFVNMFLLVVEQIKMSLNIGKNIYPGGIKIIYLKIQYLNSLCT